MKINYISGYTENFKNIMNRLTEKYDEQFFQITGIGEKNLDISNFSKNFFNETEHLTDVSVDSNANVRDKSVRQYTREVFKPHLVLNALGFIHAQMEKKFSLADADSALEKIINGEIFVNDLYSFPYSPYCYSFSLQTLLNEGMQFINSGLTIKPPKHSRSFINLVVQSISFISNQNAGASAFPDLFVCLDWFLRKEYGEDYVKLYHENETIKTYLDETFQHLIYSFNYPYRAGLESPFTNLSIFDKGFMKKLFTGYVYPDFSKPDIDSVYELQKRFAEYFNDIFLKEGIFTFPVITLSISVKDHEAIDKDFVDWVVKVNKDKGIFNIYVGKPTSIANCCRLKTKLDLGFQNSFGAAGLSIGSHKVVGLNMPRIALRSKYEDVDPYDLIDENIDLVHKLLLVHRAIINKRVKDGFLPLYKTNWMNLKRQYSTVGFLGSYEFLEILDKPMRTDEGKEYLINILEYINGYNDKISEKTKTPFNLEQIPGESMAVRLATKDSITYDLKDYYKFYSNQYYPLVADVPIIERIKTQGMFDQQTGGGSILHINMIDTGDGQKAEKFNKLLIEECIRSGAEYFAINHCFNQCENGHFTVGSPSENICPTCGADIKEQFTRVVGFITPKKTWNKERRENEFDKRVYY